MEQYFGVIHKSSPALRFCEQFDDKSALWNNSRHSHPYIELLFFRDGMGKLEVSGIQMSVSLFDAVAYPAGWEHQEEVQTEYRREVICLWIDLPELQLPEPIHLHDRDGTLERLFLMIYGEFKRRQPEPLLLEQGLKLLLMMMMRNYGERRLADGTLAYVLQYIHAHYMERITLDQLAKLEHISKSYLSRKFKKQMGMTVISYINQLRMEAAKHLLIGSDMQVNEIAYRVGFESPKYFYRMFKRETDEAPASFRRKYAKQSD